jgi:hypothetical protein
VTPTSGLFTYLNANKRGVTADLSTPEGQAFLHRLLADADILIHNVTPAERPTMSREPQICGVSRADRPAMSIFGGSRPGQGGEVRADGFERRRLGLPQPGRLPYRTYPAEAVRASDFHTGATPR